MAYDFSKYKAFPKIRLPHRQWPDKHITQAPKWCSVDLRDGNQALIEPMSIQQKITLFELLVDIGFTEIEVGFPAASRADLEFTRFLIDGNRIPDHVTIQVLTQARPEIIKKTFEAVKNAHRVIMHVYSPTSPLQRRKVLNLNKDGVVSLAVEAAKTARRYAGYANGTDWTFQFSPESFSATETDFAVEICNRVSDVWQPTIEKKMIVTLPATVEIASPNIYADQVEWFCNKLENRSSIIVSTHTHNDRGCAIAAAELGVMAGAERVEGTLIGNGERTGNTDLLVMAMNLYSQGIDPGLDLRQMDRIVSVVEYCTNIDVHPRHPYCGGLVYTAFSGGHQDAIRKCLDTYVDGQDWEVPYLPIDPTDIGRSYRDIIRINSQSGKGGVAFVLESMLGVRLPGWVQVDFSNIVQRACDASEKEIDARSVWQLFKDAYMSGRELLLTEFNYCDQGRDKFRFAVRGAGRVLWVDGANDDLGQVIQGLCRVLELDCAVTDLHVQPMRSSRQFMAHVRVNNGAEYFLGSAVSSSPAKTAIKAALSGLEQIIIPKTKSQDDRRSLVESVSTIPALSILQRGAVECPL